MLLIICVERLLHIGSHFSLRKWRRRPHFPTKLVAAASFSYKIDSGGKDLATLLAAVLTWSGYWIIWKFVALELQKTFHFNDQTQHVLFRSSFQLE